ncbi:MAG: AP2 domain-containing protein [Sedimentisphaerales bacterium]
MYLKFQIKIPAIIENVVVYFLLRYRKKKFGYPFRKIKLIGGKSAEARLGETNLAAAKFAKVDPEDYPELSKYPWQLVESGMGKGVLYAGCVDGWKILYMHRVIMKGPEGKVIDHRNRNGLDNTKRNLRIATHSQNSFNRPTGKSGSSRYRGVCYRKRGKKWEASIFYNGTYKYLGRFENEEDAARAHDEAAKIYHGEFAVLNFP